MIGKNSCYCCNPMLISGLCELLRLVAVFRFDIYSCWFAPCRSLLLCIVVTISTANPMLSWVMLPLISYHRWWYLLVFSSLGFHSTLCLVLVWLSSLSWSAPLIVALGIGSHLGTWSTLLDSTYTSVLDLYPDIWFAPLVLGLHFCHSLDNLVLSLHL